MNTQQLTQLLLALAPYLVPILAAILVPVVKSFLDRLPAATRIRIAEITATAVNATEQVMAPDASPTQKKAEAIRRIEAGLAQAKLSVPASVYDSLLEEAVLMLNVLEGKPIVGGATPDDQPTIITPRVTSKFVETSKQGAE